MDNLFYINEEMWFKQLKLNKVNNLIVRNKVTKLTRLIDSILYN